ncbi:motility associated factor glycosyltransferase family protein [Neptunicella sp.]|uniref:motility associated factor glycosyltransferase family protein n=1 Tax=Neptunicella sp. TaxID=2125986 RepID=UPI003F68C3FD
MLKNIRLHLDKNEEHQSELELRLSERIQPTYQANLRAFRQYIPSLLPYIKEIRTKNVALFCNKYGQTNIVDYGVGRTFYGLEPDAEIVQQFNHITEHCPYMDLMQSTPVLTLDKQSLSALKNSNVYHARQQSQPLPANVDVLVVFGLALGKHIQLLIEQHHIKHLVIYEPELQYFQCSALATDWEKILSDAQAKGTAIYLQLEKDGRNLVEDMQELAEHFSAKGFYYYQHYNHPVFSSITKELQLKSWASIQKDGISYTLGHQYQDYLPIWTPAVELTQYQDVDPADDALFKQNMQAFESYFPRIYKEFSDYQPKAWRPMKSPNGMVNIVKMDSLQTWYGDNPQHECILNFDNFSEQPNKDGLVLGYKGTKLRHYTHYRFVAQTEELLNEVEEEQGLLPDTLKALIMFGIGAGYQIEHLFSQYKVEKLFLCEPNRDFFYASLYAIDWASILKTVDETGARIYINIGDDGTNLFRDLLNQFYSIGPYILTNTYFYQSYFNSNLVHAIAQLREQLQVVISMGEYYDHARYGIAHTTAVINQNYPLLVSKPAHKLTFENKSVPIFMIGNGPSLDSAIEAIKEWQDRVIVVSCGTSLQVLHKNGIVPDFHAEIEQNRATFDWSCRIGDLKYLKQISLVSCNGIHPETCGLFKDVYVAFKEGESSTVSALKILGEDKFEKLKFAFPTVSNFVMNLFTRMGFHQIYLIGIDLGFADNKQHHSKHSGYYDQNGDEMYDYAAKNNTALVVPGNFRKTVFTKHEFKVSKTIIEQSLASAKAECFNCSDGAKIVGSIPLRFDNILVTTTTEQKKFALISIKQQAFVKANQEHDYLQRFLTKFSPKRLNFELSKVIERVKMEVNNVEEAEGLIESQKTMLFASYQEGKSLLFYLLYGTVNYANAVFSKLTSTITDQHSNKITAFEQARQAWISTLNNIASDCKSVMETYDSSSSFALQRERALIDYYISDYSVACGVTDVIYQGLIAWFPNTEHQPDWVLLSDCQQCPSAILLDSDESNAVAKVILLLSTMPSDGECEVFVVGRDRHIVDVLHQQAKGLCRITFVYQIDLIENKYHLDDFAAGKVPLQTKPQMIRYYAQYFLDRKNIAYIIPKLVFTKNITEVRQFYGNTLTSVFADVTGYIEFPSYLAIPRDPESWPNCLTNTLGHRGRYVAGKLELASLFQPILTKERGDRLVKDLSTLF